MTKLKSKKMSKSTFAIIIMAIAMVAMLAFGGTYAYFTANAAGSTTSGVKTGIVEITNTDPTDKIAANAKVVTGSYIFGSKTGDVETEASIAVNNKSNVKTYIFATISASVKIGDTEHKLFVSTDNGATGTDLVLLNSTLNGSNGTTWTKYENSYYIIVDPTANPSTGTPVTAFTFTAKINDDLVANRTQGANPGYSHNVYTTVGGSPVAFNPDIMDQEVVVTVSFAAVQYDNLSGTDAAGKLATAYSTVVTA